MNSGNSNISLFQAGKQYQKTRHVSHKVDVNTIINIGGAPFKLFIFNVIFFVLMKNSEINSVKKNRQTNYVLPFHYRHK